MGSLPLKITHQREQPPQFCCPRWCGEPKGQHGAGRRKPQDWPSQGGESGGEAAVPSSLLCSPHEVLVPEH